MPNGQSSKPRKNPVFDKAEFKSDVKKILAVPGKIKKAIISARKKESIRREKALKDSTDRMLKE